MKTMVGYSLKTIIFTTIFISFSPVFAAQPQPETKPSLTQNAIQSIENSLNVFKQNPETLVKSDILLEKTISEIANVEKTLEKDLTKEEQKKIGKALEKEGKQFSKELEIFVKHHTKHLDHKIEKILGKDKKDRCHNTIEAAKKNIADTAKDLKIDDNKKLGKELEASYQPIKEAFDVHCSIINESNNVNQ